MTDNPDMDMELGEGLDGEGEGEKKRFSVKLIAMVLGGLVVLGGGGFAAMTFLSGDDDSAGEESVAEGAEASGGTAEASGPQLFVEMPEMLVNLNTGGTKSSFLKLRVALEVDRDAARGELETKMPRVVDQFQVYMRELRVEDLNGSAGMARLKEELLMRVNAAVAPTQVRDVLFQEMIVQ